jgi:mono/diheme cytochrome c family protein
MDWYRKPIFSIPAMAGLLVFCAASHEVQAQAPESVWDGAYTQAQAQRGETQYKLQCAVCHGDALEGDAQTERGKQLNRVLPPL